MIAPTACSKGAPDPLLSVRDLAASFAPRGLFGGGLRVRVLSGVSFSLGRGETLALVGESGSGKTTTARVILRLLAADSGSVSFDGEDWLSLPRRELNLRRKKLGVVFQDPATSLNPRLRVADIVGEPLEIHRVGTRRERRARVEELLQSVNLPPSSAERFPAEFSGGQRQRIAIARALALSPSCVILDEPVSALDLSVRAQVLNLLLDLQEKSPARPAYLFIGHDLAVVRHIADRVAVMYLGRIVEEGRTEDVFRAPRHPYTAALLAAQPGARVDAPTSAALAGEPPSPASPPTGCAFHPRCPFASARCSRERPPFVAEPAPSPVSSARGVACFFPLG